MAVDRAILGPRHVKPRYLHDGVIKRWKRSELLFELRPAGFRIGDEAGVETRGDEKVLFISSGECIAKMSR